MSMYVQTNTHTYIHLVYRNKASKQFDIDVHFGSHTALDNKSNPEFAKMRHSCL